MFFFGNITIESMGLTDLYNTKAPNLKMTYGLKIFFKNCLCGAVQSCSKIRVEHVETRGFFNKY